MAGLLVVTLLLGAGPAATAALAVAALLFAVGAVRGAQGTVQGVVFSRWIRPRLRPTAEREDPRPPRFAQVVGLVITGSGVVLAVLGLDAAVPVAAGVALVAAFLNAAFGFCLGCEMYVLGRRVLHRA
ncbi:DUF4395 domain-containing protein [Actinotalea sp. BY-33]|uniref:DUF4395 domain-containing protein n=2 Tax=Actinotalea soli TaxID=2819234 RepID=A0A939LN47_9CELL|nr:DUF4395 domain-containing protein [Actinotalea soli]